MPELSVTIDVEEDGVPAPGFPYNDTLKINDWFCQTISLASTLGFHVSLENQLFGPTFEDTAGRMRFLLLMPLDGNASFRTYNQANGSIPVLANQFICFAGARVERMPLVAISATTKFLVMIGRVN